MNPILFLFLFFIFIFIFGFVFRFLLSVMGEEGCAYRTTKARMVDEVLGMSQCRVAGL